MLISQTPLRISFAGGGTDLEDYYRSEEGTVLSTAIDKYIFVLVKERYDDKIVLSWTIKEIVNNISEIQHDLIREGLLLTKANKGLEVITTADIPSEGSGLGSSSAVTVGLLNAFHTFQGELVSSEQLAQEACKIEIETLRNPVGKQDQYIAAYGNFRQFTFHCDGSVTTEFIDISDETKRLLKAQLVLFYTNKTRSAAQILSEQKNNIGQRRDILKKMKNQVFELRRYLENGEVDGVGDLLHEGWCLKQRLSSQITNSEIDVMYHKARQAGAIGGKVLGAGGGGFMLLFCPVEKQEELRHALRMYKEMPFRFESGGSKVIFNIKQDTWKI